MSDTDNKLDPHLYQLILSLHAGAMQHMGKVASPFTGKIERDLNAARHTIDMLDMLKRKTDRNLTADEQRLLDHVLYELRLNFVDESKKGDQPGPEDGPEEASESVPPDREQAAETNDDEQP